MWLIGLGVASGVIGFGTYLQNKKKVREQEEVKALARRRAEVSSKFRNDKAEIEKAFSAFFFEIKTEWPYCIPLKVVGDVRSYLMMSRDGSFIRVANLIYIGSRGVRLKARDIATARIRSVRVYQGQTVLTTSVKQEREVIEPGKSKSSIKRAIVGGIVLGPVGAVVGAVSGIGTHQPTIRTVSEYIPQTKAIDGDPYLITECDDLSEPILELKMPSLTDAENWRARIEAAIARQGVQSA